MKKLTKKFISTVLENYGLEMSPCITPCEAGDMRLYKKSGHTYYATINFANGKLKFNNREYNDVDLMVKDIEDYNATLEFNPDTYNPDYNTEAITDMRINTTIRKCGYKGSGYQHGTLDGCYVADGVLGFKFPSISGNAILLSGSSFVEMYDKNDSDSVKSKKIMSMLGALYAANISNLASKLADMGSLDTLSSITIKTFNPDTFEVSTSEGIDGVISILENTLSRLKKVKDKKD